MGAMIDSTMMTAVIGAIHHFPDRLEEWIGALHVDALPDGRFNGGEEDFRLVANALRAYVPEIYILADDGTVLGVRPEAYFRHADRKEGDPPVVRATYASPEARHAAASLVWPSDMRRMADTRQFWEDAGTLTERQRNIAASAACYARRGGRRRRSGGGSSGETGDYVRVWGDLTVTLRFAHGSEESFTGVAVHQGEGLVFAASGREGRGKDKTVRLTLDADVPGDWDVRFNRA